MSRRGVCLGMLIVLVLVLVACGALFVVGSIRYGGPAELLLRARIALAERRSQPHPQFAPTPLPTPLPEPVGGVVATAGGVEAGAATTGCITADCGVPAPIGIAPAAATQRAAPAAVADLPPAATPDMGAVSPPITPVPVVMPAEQPTATPLPSATPTPLHLPAATVVELTGVTHMWQKWNNCGPATLAMYLSFFGRTMTQAEVAAALKPYWDDRNINPDELATFARAQGLQALVRVNGDNDRLRLLLTNGIPVMIESWLKSESGDGLGHYRLLTGYDDVRQLWTAYDSFVMAGVRADVPYTGIPVPYADMDHLWSAFNRTYILVFPADLAPVVASILEGEMDDGVMWQRALTRTRAEAESRPGDAFAQFNLGTSLVAVGEYEEAAAAFDRARIIGLPFRMLWYQFGPFRAYYETGRHAELIALADATIATEAEVEEVYYYKGLGLAALDRPAEAHRSWQRALELNPNYAAPAAELTAAAGDPVNARP